MKEFVKFTLFITLMIVAILTGCKDDDEIVKKVTGVTLNATTLELIEGKTQVLTATVVPQDATNKTVTWKSSKPTIATVDNKGKVTAIKKGTATITVTTTDGNKTATCKVTVKAKIIHVTEVKLDKTDITKTEGETEQLTATVLPDNASNKVVAWNSSNKTIATVDDKGLVTAVKKGTAIITVTTTDGNKTATCKVTVKAKVIHVTEVKLDKTDITKTEGETEQLTATVLPDNATNKAITWSSSDKNIATVDNKGLVTAIKKGTATITVTTTDGNKTTTCKVIVKTKPTNEKMVLTTTKAIGEKIKLKIYAFPTDQAGVWIDLNNNGQKDNGEDNINFGSFNDYTLGTQTITIYGKVIYLYCEKNYLTQLDITKNTALTQLFCNANQLTQLDVTKNTALEILYFPHNQLTQLDVTKNTELKSLYCQANQLTQLDVTQNTTLKILGCGYNQLTHLDVTKNTTLTQLYCQASQLTQLDVTQNMALKSLYCQANQLTQLDVTKNTELKFLYCYSNQLTQLDVTKNTTLTQLYCYSNQLTQLDVTKNTALTELHCYSNQLTQLDVSKNTILRNLKCSSNQLTQLDVSKNTILRNLKCYSNQLTELDVTQNTALTRLYCQSNKLTQLNVAKNTNTALTELYCHFNQLTQLDVTKNTALTKLYCSSNQLTQLDVTKNTVLEILSCSSNQLMQLNVANDNNGKISYLNTIKCPKLTCIKVDKGFNPPSSWKKDDTAIWRNDGSECP